MNTMRTWAAVGAAALVMAGLAGCSAPVESGSPVAAPITLTIGTDDEPGAPAADQIEYFADRVADLSDGAITIEPEWKAAGEDKPD